MLGIDFGTSNTVVAEGSRVVRVEGGSDVLQSVMFISRDEILIGQEAVDAYRNSLSIYKNELDKKFRFFQGLKLALKEEEFEGTTLFGDRKTGEIGNYIKMEMLVGLFLTLLKDRVDQRNLGFPTNEVVLGRPVALSTDPKKDRKLQERFREACEYAGFGKVHFVYEPVAATMSLVGRTEGNVLVFDFGGGTLDVSVANIKGSKVEILASRGRDIGGYTLNEDLSRARVIKHFGYGSFYETRLTGKTLTVPYYVTDQLVSFYQLPLGKVENIRNVVKDLIFETPGHVQLKGLYEFLNRSLGYQLYDAIDDTKIELSSSQSSHLRFDVEPYVYVDELVTRGEFEEIIKRRLDDAKDLVIETLNAAGLDPAQISHVVRVGGSSQIPAFVNMLNSLFPGKVERGEIFTSIATGLIAAHEAGLSST